ncbi:hypothetical protein MKMG_02223 [Methanogenium sp. MK-MG]|nr:hypothetical protein MKMG_02223 [Methanogenium sp. MK-MG]
MNSPSGSLKAARATDFSFCCANAAASSTKAVIEEISSSSAPSDRGVGTGVGDEVVLMSRMTATLHSVSPNEIVDQ